MNNILISVPGAPVAKGRPRLSTVNGHARAYTPAKTRKYEDLIRLEAGRVMEGRDQLQGPLLVIIKASVAMPQAIAKSVRKCAAALDGRLLPTSRPDVDNYAKVIDALNGIVWRDDSQITTLIVSKRYSLSPSLEMNAREIEL